MPTNANIFNSRVTSEALEAKFRQVFPSQGGAELPQDLFASGVIQPVVDFSTVAEGSVLPQNLQTAWDFATGAYQNATGSFTTIISNPGFWQVDLTYAGLTLQNTSSRLLAQIDIYDGSTSKPVWGASNSIDSAAKDFAYIVEGKFVVFLRSGDVLRGKAQSTDNTLDV